MTKIAKPRWRCNYAVLTPSTPGETLLDIDTRLVEELYKEHGALLFRGYALEAETFGALAETYCTHAVFNESGGRDMVDGSRVIQTVNKGELAFSLHPELPRVPWRPDVCWFGCLVPPESGGETTICDGTKIVRKMPKLLYNKLAGQRLQYRCPSTPEETRYWLRIDEIDEMALRTPPADCPFTFEREADGIYCSFTAPMLHKPMFCDDPCFGNFLLFSRYNNNNYGFPTFDDGTMVPAQLTDAVRILGEACTVPIRWHANDVLMVDNSRFMHGRRAIRDTGHREILTYFGYLKFAVPSEEEGPNPRWRNPDLWRTSHTEMGLAA